MPLVLLLAGCDRAPPEPLPWKSDATATVTIKAGPVYEVSRWWGCSWANACPTRDWRWCLHVVPHNAERAWEIYKEKNQIHLDTIARYRQYRAARPYYERYRTDMAELEPAKLERAVEEFRRVELDFQSWERKDAAGLADVLERMRGGADYFATYGISRAGTSKESRGWSFAMDRDSVCLKIHGGRG